MERGDELQKTRRELSREDFEGKFPYLWLIRELDEDERAPSSFNTLAFDGRRTLAMGKKLRENPAGMVTRQRIDPGRYGLYAVTKSGANPWSDRIMVGRASNNDVVFRHESVSKVHAYFHLGPDGGWRLHDAKSANGTRVDGANVLPSGDGIEVRSGTVVSFGSLTCEVVASAELYDVL